MKTSDAAIYANEFILPAAETDSSAVRFRHIPALDGLRGIAVLFVMVYHLELLVPALHEWVKGGFLGVDIFFVLSGFLITSVLIKEESETKKISLKNFYLRRFLRLMPAFWLFLVVLFFFGYFILPTNEANLIYSNNNFLYTFFYLSNWHLVFNEAGIMGNLNHTWSLAIEEQFYIFWSLFLFFAFGDKRSRRQITLITTALLAFLILFRAVRIHLGFTTTVLYYSTDSRMDALLFGCAASMIFNWRLWSENFLRSRLFGYLTLIFSAAAIFILLNVSHETLPLYYGVFSVFAAAVALVILWLAANGQSKFHRVLEMRWLMWIGRISYGLYLWHYVSYEFAKKTFASPIAQVFTGILFAFLVSTLSFYLLERPFLKLKDGIGGLKLKRKFAT